MAPPPARRLVLGAFPNRFAGDEEDEAISPSPLASVVKKLGCAEAIGGKGGAAPLGLPTVGIFSKASLSFVSSLSSVCVCMCVCVCVYLCRCVSVHNPLPPSPKGCVDSVGCVGRACLEAGWG
jgi:hypothetical protein